MEERRMTVVGHLDMFYETRAEEAIHVSDSDPCNSPNTELTSVPESAEIRYDGYPDRELDATSFENLTGEGYKLAQFLIERAMLDPDATVIPK